MSTTLAHDSRKGNGRGGVAAASEPRPRPSSRGVIVNAMTVDVEDYFHVAAFEGHLSREDWPRMPARVWGNTHRILELFDEYAVKATFFVLGWVAERHPELVRDLARRGHEVASHGYSHRRVTELTPAEFRGEVRRAKALLEDLAGQPVLGYRAPTYSIGRDTLWALDVLGEEGHRYSSSIYPIRHDLYGLPDAPRFAFRSETGLVEIPITTTRLFGVNLPCGGGGYFRLLPYRLSRWMLRRVHRKDREPCVFYFHPWEIDPEQPRQRGLRLRSRLRHYMNLDAMEGRIRRLVRDLAWDRLDRVFAERLAV